MTVVNEIAAKYGLGTRTLKKRVAHIGTWDITGDRPVKQYNPAEIAEIERLAALGRLKPGAKPKQKD